MNGKPANTPPSIMSRRIFLGALGVGGAATIAAVTHQSSTGETTAQRDEKPSTSRYQLTEHIRNYYRTTLV